LRRQLEAQIHALRADVEEQIAGRGDRMTRARLDFPEWMQLGWSRRPKDPIPNVRSKSHHAGKASLKIAEADCA
jgi:hypothetical protein